MDISDFLTVAASTVSGKPEPSVGVVVATGLIIVFGVLVLLYLLISLEGVIFTAIDRRKKGTPAAPKQDAPAAPAPAAPMQKAAAKAPSVEAGISGEVVAAIAAAIACMENGRGFVLRSVRRVQSDGRRAWGQAGINTYTEPF